jgi:hypothetical protein
MSNLYIILKHMMPAAEVAGNIREVSMDENWIGMGRDRVSIEGKTNDGRKFSLVMEIEGGEENA